MLRIDKSTDRKYISRTWGSKGVIECTKKSAPKLNVVIVEQVCEYTKHQ